MLRYMTAGESHGRGILGVLEGMPAGLKIDEKLINWELRRRMHGYGRGVRMAIEADTAEVLSGIHKGMSIGSPISVLVRNKDFKIDELDEVKCPRPGHADLAGMQKFGFGDARTVLERASARETAGKVAIGAVAKLLLRAFGIRVISHVTMIGGVQAKVEGLSFDQIVEQADVAISKLRCADKEAEKLMCQRIDQAKEKGDTLGGTVEVIVDKVPPGLGSYTQWDKKLDGNLARALVSIQAVKAVSIGKGIEAASLDGSKVHDPIGYNAAKKKFTRSSNNAGGLEGGLTNGEQIVVKLFMKPIATLNSPLDSVNIDTKNKDKASTERSDVAAVSACGVVAEAACALEVASAFLEKFGGDSIAEVKRNYEGYLHQLKEI